jgi:enterochelin esterase-like enzyme
VVNAFKLVPVPWNPAVRSEPAEGARPQVRTVGQPARLECGRRFENVCVPSKGDVVTLFHRPPPTGAVPIRTGRQGAALLAVTAVLGAGTVLAASPVQAHTPAATAAAKAKSPAPVVKHTGVKPTGYTVTFRYDDPAATRVQIKGEWSFSDAAHTTTSSSQGLVPEQWIKGDFPIAWPNSTAANWPVLDMKKNKAGIWSLTVPLPSGTFTYGFFVDCASATGSGCTEIADPANLPWNAPGGVSTGSTEPDSEVYVPSDRKFGTTDFSWQAPVAAKKQGTLADVSYPSPQSTAPAGSHPLAVYTPPGYDPARAQPYPTLYLSHGAGGQEVDWSTQGAAGAILDNLITSGQAQPMVVVMTDFNGLPNGATGYADDLIQNVLPYVQAHYNVSAQAADRAFAGLSAGGQRANTLLFNNTAVFGYYSVMSNAGGYPATPTADQITALGKTLGIQIGGGIQDPLRPTTTTEETLLSTAGVPFTDDSVNGGHEWYVWRILLHDFVSQQAFKATTTTLSVAAGSRGNETATAVVAAGTGPVATGSVQFTLDGVRYGKQVKLQDGTASLKIKGLQGGSHTLTATYSGDALHTASQATQRG